MSEPKTEYTSVSDMLKAIPRQWRNARVAVGDTIHNNYPVKRVALHESADGNRVVILHYTEVEVRRKG